MYTTVSKCQNTNSRLQSSNFASGTQINGKKSINILIKIVLATDAENVVSLKEKITIHNKIMRSINNLKI